MYLSNDSHPPTPPNSECVRRRPEFGSLFGVRGLSLRSHVRRVKYNNVQKPRQKFPFQK